MDKMKASAMLVMLIFAAIAGCIAMSEEQIAQKMKEKYNEIEDYRAEVITEIYQNGENTVNEVELKFKKPDKFWIKDKNTGIVTVINGDTSWEYNPQKNEVRVLRLKGREEKQAEMDFGSIVRDMTERYNIKLHGSEKVSSRDCFILELTPKKGKSNIKQKLWVDKEYWFPVKMEIEMEILNRTIKSSVLYKNIEFNTGLSDSEFVFETPPGARVVEREIKLPERLTLEEAKKRVDFEVVTPEYLPEGYEFDSAMVSDIGGETSLLLTYKKGSNVIIISEETISQVQSIPNSEEVDINGNKGEIVAIGQSSMVRWRCNELLLSISSQLDKEELLKVARSIKCGGG